MCGGRLTVPALIGTLHHAFARTWALHSKTPCPVGMSLNGQGKLRGRGKDRAALVEEYIKHRSTDFVAFPATVNSLAESTAEEPGDGLHVAAPADIVEAQAQEQEPSQMETKTLEAIDERLADMQAKLTEAEDARKKAEAKLAKREMVDAAIAESKREVPAALKALLEKCDTREEMDAALAAIPTAKPQTAPPAADAPTKPIAEGKDKTKAIDTGLDALFESCQGAKYSNGMKVAGVTKAGR